MDAYLNIPLGDDPSDPDPEAFDRASTTIVLTFYAFKVLLNIKRNSSTFLPPSVFMQQPIAICCDLPVM